MQSVLPTSPLDEPELQSDHKLGDQNIPSSQILHFPQASRRMSLSVINKASDSKDTYFSHSITIHCKPVALHPRPDYLFQDDLFPKRENWLG